MALFFGNQKVSLYGRTVADKTSLKEDITIMPNKELGTIDEELYDEYSAPYVDENGKAYDGVEKIKVRKVGSWIDSQISQDNIRKGHTILGVAGNVIEKRPTEITVKSRSSNDGEYTDVYTLKDSDDKNAWDKITVKSYSVTQPIIEPSVEDQVIYPSELGKDAFSSVRVKAVRPDIEPNLKPENIKSGVRIFQVNGTYETPFTSKEVEINPSTEQQIITAQNEGVSGITKITANPVTAAIDSNIKSKNIKPGVTILGVQGSYIPEGTEEITILPKKQRQVKYPSDNNTISKVTVEAVTASADTNIQPENIKMGINILGVEGEYTGTDIAVQPPVTVTPTKVAQSIQPDENYTYLSRVDVEGVTAAIDPNILAENIRKNIEILGVMGTMKPDEHKFQTSKTVTPTLNDQTIEPDTDKGYDALMKVIVKAVEASIDPNIIPKNIKKNVNILGVIGELEAGEPQKWFDFNEIQTVNNIGSKTNGGQSEKPSLINIESTDYDITKTLPIITESNSPIADISAVLFTVVLGYEDEEAENPIISAPFIWFKGGNFYKDYSTYVKIPDRLAYLYPYQNDYNVTGCLLNSDSDVNEEKTYQLYLLVGNAYVPVLVDGNFNSEMLPEGFERAIYVREFTIPAHDAYVLKEYISGGKKTVSWILKDKAGVNYVFEEHENSPMTVSISANDLDYGTAETSTPINGVGDKVANFYNTGCTIDSNHIATGFSRYNEIISSANEPSVWSTCEITTKIEIVDNSVVGSIISWTGKDIRLNGNKLRTYDSENVGDFVLENGKTYWARIIKTSSTYSLYGLEDNNYTLNTLPDIDQWTLSATFNNDVTNFKGMPLCIGMNIDGWDESFKNNKIYLDDTQVKFDDVVCWSAYINNKFEGGSNHRYTELENDLIIANQAYGGIIDNYTDTGDAVELNLYRVQNRVADGIAVPFITPTLTSNGTLGGSSFAVSASDTLSNDYYNYGAYKAFDKTISGGNYYYYHSNNSSNTHWITMYNPKPWSLKAIQILYRDNYRPTNYFIYGSNDNTNWDLLNSGNTTSTNTNYGFDVISANNNKFYKYYRFQGTQTTNTYWLFNEIRVYATIEAGEGSMTYGYMISKDENFDVNVNPNSTKEFIQKISIPEHIPYRWDTDDKEWKIAEPIEVEVTYPDDAILDITGKGVI